MIKTILLPDIHYPYHNKKAWLVVLKFLRWFKPHTIVLAGDALEMRAVDHWKREKGNLRHFEGIRLLHDYEQFIEDILEPLEKICHRAKKIYMGGNHEVFANRVVDQNPQLEGLIEPENALKLKKRGWEWIPYIVRGKHGSTHKGMLKIGKLTVIHGEYTNKFHASKTADCYLKSVLYFHTHDLQLFTKVTAEDPSDYHTCQSGGCLCDKSPQYLWGRPNRWVHSFAILYTRKDGLFNIYTPVIINGTFTYAGRTFSWK